MRNITSIRFPNGIHHERDSVMKKMTPRFRHFAMFALLLTLSASLIAQGKHDRDDHDNPGHGGMPPGQAKHMEEGRRMPPGQEKHYFRDEDRDRFYAHYRVDADRWRGRRRPVFVVGQPIVRTYVVQPVPRSVWVNMAPPPPNCQYGYYGGYVVAYNPATRVVADVMDIVGAVTH